MPERHKRPTTHQFRISAPALRDRVEDIPVFMNNLLRKFCRMHGRSAAISISREMGSQPGNRISARFEPKTRVLGGTIESVSGLR